MPRWALVLLLVAAVVCAGIGMGLLNPTGTARFGWTAYAPLSVHSGDAVYMPVDLVWLSWQPRIGAMLLALGAGTAGAALVALLLRRPVKPTASN
jgi:heme/copper-type cytochrome/quinol oxidase subunit 1